ALAALGVVDEAERRQRPGQQPRLLERLAAGRRLQVGLAVVRDALRNAPRGSTVVAAGRVNEQHLDVARGPAVEERAGGLLGRDALGHDSLLRGAPGGSIPPTARGDNGRSSARFL